VQVNGQSSWPVRIAPLLLSHSLSPKTRDIANFVISTVKAPGESVRLHPGSSITDCSQA
jgi:hypothetical protein